MKRYQEAKVKFAKAVEINPNFVEGYLGLERVLTRLGKLKEAEQIKAKVESIKGSQSNSQVMENEFKKQMTL